MKTYTSNRNYLFVVLCIIIILTSSLLLENPKAKGGVSPEVNWIWFGVCVGLVILYMQFFNQLRINERLILLFPISFISFAFSFRIPIISYPNNEHIWMLWEKKSAIFTNLFMLILQAIIAVFGLYMYRLLLVLWRRSVA